MNLLLYQAVWFAAVLGREHYVYLILTLLALHLLLCRERGAELAVIAGCSAIGVAADCLLVMAGVFVFEPAPDILPIPI